MRWPLVAAVVLMLNVTCFSPGITPDIPPAHIPDEWAHSWSQGKSWHRLTPQMLIMLHFPFLLSLRPLYFNQCICNLMITMTRCGTSRAVGLIVCILQRTSQMSISGSLYLLTNCWIGSKPTQVLKCYNHGLCQKAFSINLKMGSTD